jgi:hypothetical protein
MDPLQFDHLSKFVAASDTRRTLVQALAALPVGGQRAPSSPLLPNATSRAAIAMRSRMKRNGRARRSRSA